MKLVEKLAIEIGMGPDGYKERQEWFKTHPPEFGALEREEWFAAVGFIEGFRKALELASDIPKNKDISYYDEDIKAAVLMHTIQTSILEIADQEAPEGGWIGINDKTGPAE